ncbi:MAG: DNA-binding protein [Deltaproteobacteria bacterium RIFCSPLOWO2_02_FULL_44_10]|nr:MAG: DNA-binding protein [Deltaproteobacteria bacterium RIFCSPLOWO2_02_FULL_44_10]
MNKMGLVDAVQAKIGCTKKTAEDAIDAVFDTIMATLGKGEEVTVSGFGAFMVKKRSARLGVNPRTGQKIQIAATVTPKFHAGKALKAAVK